MVHSLKDSPAGSPKSYSLLNYSQNTTETEVFAQSWPEEENNSAHSDGHDGQTNEEAGWRGGAVGGVPNPG